MARFPEQTQTLTPDRPSFEAMRTREMVARSLVAEERERQERLAAERDERDRQAYADLMAASPPAQPPAPPIERVEERRPTSIRAIVVDPDLRSVEERRIDLGEDGRPAVGAFLGRIDDDDDIASRSRARRSVSLAPSGARFRKCSQTAVSAMQRSSADGIEVVATQGISVLI